MSKFCHFFDTFFCHVENSRFFRHVNLSGIYENPSRNLHMLNKNYAYSVNYRQRNPYQSLLSTAEIAPITPVRHI